MYQRYAPVIKVEGFSTPGRLLAIPSDKQAVLDGAQSFTYAPFGNWPAAYQTRGTNHRTTANKPGGCNWWLMTPAIFGGGAAFLLGFRFFGHPFSSGYRKYVFYANIFALIATLGVGEFIFQARLGAYTLSHILIPALFLIFFYGSITNLTYSLYPFTFSGTIGDTPITQFLSFLSICIGAISVGETFNVTPEKAEVQILLAMEAIFSLFALSLITAVVAS